MAPYAWPTASATRKAHIQRLELVRPECIDHAGFLAVLGALWLEEGDGEQALIWLERALLLDPGDLGAQADHALALEMLGQPDALIELARAWRGRSDLPPALREKLFPAERQAGTRVPSIKLGGAVAPVWQLYREVSLLLGYENNLDHSPRLTELTLTTIEGPLVLPVISQPRRGAALLGNASLQLAYNPENGRVWRTGLNVNARSAPAAASTDWQQVQWASSASQQWAWWRGQAELGFTWVGGRLSEPYNITRLGLSAQTQTWGCASRVALDFEKRTQSQTASFNSHSSGLLASHQCPIASVPGWAWTLALRGGTDEPDSTTRPGGRQQAWSAGLRLAGPIGVQTRLETHFRLGRTSDALGYSALLDNDARRVQRQSQFALELSRRLYSGEGPGAEALLQWHVIRQNSNLDLFKNSAQSLYAGVRWAW